MLTYDAVWKTFLDNFKVNDEDLPSDDNHERIYQDIRNAVMRLNNRLRTKLECDDEIEVINGTDSDDYLFLIAHYIRLIYLINEKTLYESLYQPISQDVGIKNYRTQMSSLESSIKRQQSDIESFIFNMSEDFL